MPDASGRRLDRYPAGPVKLHLGGTVTFDGTDTYAVRAISPDGWWAICTRSHLDGGRMVQEYTIIDFASNVRGPDDRVFSRGYMTEAQIQDNMLDLMNGRLEVSVRRDMRLHITDVQPAP